MRIGQIAGLPAERGFEDVRFLKIKVITGTTMVGLRSGSPTRPNALD
jgi:hypothetical protein